MTTLDHPILPEVEIRALITAYRAGDNEAAERVIAHNEKAIRRIASRYHVTGVCGDVPMDDLMQWGRMGILRAMKDFDVDGSTKFITYAWAWIRQSISRYGRHEGQQVSMSYKAAERRGTVGKTVTAFTQEHHRSPTTAEISSLTGLSEDYIASLRAPTISMDAPVTTSNGKTVADFIPDPYGDPAAEIEDALMMDYIIEKIKRLSKKRQTVIIAFYGLDGKPARNLKTIAESMGVSPERVRQLREDALAELR